MFTLLVVEKRRRGIKGMLGQLRRPRLEEHRTLNIPWRLIRAPAGRKGLDWRRIESLAGRHRARLVSSAEYVPPKDSPVRIARLYDFERILAARAICRVLEGQPHPITIGIIDPNGRCLSAVELLLEQTDCVKIFTRLPHRYEWFARRMLEQRGAPVILCGSPRGMADCRIILLGGLCEGWQSWISSGAVVFSAAGQQFAAGCGVVSDFVPDCPEELEKQIPPGVPAEDLCAALYRLSACRELISIEAGECRMNGRRMGMTELVGLLGHNEEDLAGRQPLRT